MTVEELLIKLEMLLEKGYILRGSEIFVTNDKNEIMHLTSVSVPMIVPKSGNIKYSTMVFGNCK